MPFTMFAPMASRVSTSRCSTSMSRSAAPAAPPSGARWWNTSTSRAPPPRATIFGCRLLARLTTSSLRLRSACRARSTSATFTTWTWPIRIGSVTSVAKPPARRTVRAAPDKPATMDGSSTDNGTMTSRPSTRKLRPTPSGRPNTPTTFSIILSATCSFRVCAPVSSARKSSSVSAVRSRRAAMRASTPILKKLGIREPLLGADSDAILGDLHRYDHQAGCAGFARETPHRVRLFR